MWNYSPSWQQFQYRIRQPTLLHTFLIPLLDTTELMTESKAYDSWKFKQALTLSMQDISTEIRNTRLTALKNHKHCWRMPKKQIPTKENAKMPPKGFRAFLRQKHILTWSILFFKVLRGLVNASCLRVYVLVGNRTESETKRTCLDFGDHSSKCY